MPSSTDADLLARRQAALDWILRAQRATPNGGASAFYHTSDGYCPTSYPEVTGYIVPVMWDMHAETGDDVYREAATEMIDWVTSVQTPSGAATSMDFETLYVFDTGMDILGWVRAHRETGEARWIEAAQRAGNWLVEAQCPDGHWTTTPDSGQTHTYHTRVAWALLQLHDATGAECYKVAAVRNLDWAVARRQPNDWLTIPPSRESTHFLAYAARGLLEAGAMLDSDAYISAAQGMADSVLGSLSDDGYLPGAFDVEWEPAEPSCCLTGSLQFAIIWSTLSRITADRAYADAARRTVEYVSRYQDIEHADNGVRGGVAGSEPIGGAYAPDCYLAWAAKFYVDAVNALLGESD
ncbi:hypothetical protein HN371_27550 [Candidatus Poribacteria bacterium]|jgi:hypothetical protein|nr:hypothetical protein [Candidatus Poribacteria bacterium]MBT5712731.1 hypothetical protein [Candidatus Poribacteria bacterium]MBT7100743.1 hypothetical protein [Candidatus Poribacteria bacterium]MBT7807960.1 hypothetical protein [Candidatus Poribacteria bacterium]